MAQSLRAGPNNASAAQQMIMQTEVGIATQSITANTPKPKLLARFQAVIRSKHMSLRTERAYWHWSRKMILHRGITAELNLCENRVKHVREFLEHEAIRGVSAATQNQCLNALVFLFEHVLRCPLGDLGEIPRAKRSERLPEMITDEECRAVIERLNGDMKLVASLLYGCGLRLSEALRLRVKDVDFARGLVIVREGKGDKDRLVPLPKTLRAPLKMKILDRERIHALDLLADNHGWVWMPHLLETKYPSEQKALNWQWIFCARGTSTDPRSGNIGRHHLGMAAVQKAVKLAAGKAGIKKRVHCHAFRHSYVCEMENKGVALSVIQKLVGHCNITTTQRYSQFSKSGVPKVGNPLD